MKAKGKKKIRILWLIPVCVIFVVCFFAGRAVWNKNHTILPEETVDMADVAQEDIDRMMIINENGDSSQDNSQESLQENSQGNSYLLQAEQIQNLKPDIDYVEYQLNTLADSKKEAKQIAEQVGGTLLSYEDGVAVIQVAETVYEVLQRLSEEENPPMVYPSYLYTTQ